MNARQFISAFAAALTLSAATKADRVVTTRKKLKPIQTTEQPAAPAHTKTDTLVSPVGAVRFCGYEKTLRANKETIFIENTTDSTISSITFTIEYLDIYKRQIHSRTVRQKTSIPPRETRRYDIRSWDTQKTYYYTNGDQPHKSATPYDIRITTDTILTQPCTP